ncbi:MAG: GTP cyclohydrolase I [Phycisphaerae bacterium]
MADHGLLDETEKVEALDIRGRRISPDQMARFESHIAEIFTAMGLDLNTAATRDTPRRFIQAMIDVTEGYEGDPKLIKTFVTECRGGPDCRLSQAIEGPISFFSLCEHHALPVIGRAYVGYIAHEHIIGLSKLVRLVHVVARRFTVQERIGQQIADALNAILQPHGAAVYIEAQHLCTQMRGVHGGAAATRTTYWRGNYETDEALRREFFTACGLGR